MVDRALPKPERTLEEIYGEAGRPSIAPERLLRAQLVMRGYSLRPRARGKTVKIN